MIYPGLLELCLLSHARAYEGISGAMDEDDSTDFGPGIPVGGKRKWFIGGSRLIGSLRFCRFDAVK